jgi:glycosyltransferase involved in cell wall biosynthesis
MRVIQLSTGHLGGAGLAARRLNDQLNLHGINSTFIALAQTGYVPGVSENEIERNFAVRALGSSLAAFQRSFSNQTLMSSISKSSSVVSKVRQLASPEDTIIQIHNWQNIIDFEDLGELQDLGFKIVLTLHDQRFFTGGCHYSFSCSNYEKTCSGCPQAPKFFAFIPKYSLYQSRKVVFKRDSIRIVGPSRWIVDLAGRSNVLSSIESRVFPNVLGTTWLDTVRDISFKRNTKFTIGVASMNPDSYIKGGDIIQQVQSYLSTSEYSIIYLSNFNTEGHARFWEQIDCLFVPSRADNSPNVIHEAKSLGIPILASKTGGIPEILSGDDICFEIPERIGPDFVTSIFGKARMLDRNFELNHVLVERIIARDSQIISNYKDLYSQLLS